MRCNECASCYINGTFCHETGCPNSRKEYALTVDEDGDLDIIED